MNNLSRLMINKEIFYSFLQDLIKDPTTKCRTYLAYFNVMNIYIDSINRLWTQLANFYG